VIPYSHNGCHPKLGARCECQRPRTMIGPGPLRWCPGRVRACDTRFRSSIRPRPGRGPPRVPVLRLAAVCCLRPGALMSALDVSGTVQARGRPPETRPVGRPSTTRHTDWYTSIASGRSAGQLPPVEMGRSRQTSSAGSTRDRPGRRSCGAPNGATSSCRSKLGGRQAREERGAELRRLFLNVRGRTPLCAVIVTQLDTKIWQLWWLTR
jgi:hypothetical protein